MNWLTNKKPDPRSEAPGDQVAVDAIAKIAALKQFVGVADMQFSKLGVLKGSGYLNLLNGCLVSKEKSSIRLTWQMSGYETTPHTTVLSESETIKRFVEVMELQARSIGVEVLGAQA